MWHVRMNALWQSGTASSFLGTGSTFRMSGIVRPLLSFQHTWGTMTSAASFHSSPLAKGLEEFFDSSAGWVWNEKKLPTGRAWSPTELRSKSFDDLHKLWFVCLKEQNRVLSQREEGRRFDIYFPSTTRLRQTKLTMRHIKLVLWERRIAWMQAQHVVKLEKRREELEGQEGLSKAEIASTLEEEFPIPVRQIGKSPRKVKAENSRRVVRLGKRGRHTNSAWTIV